MFYAVSRGHTIGIFEEWGPACQAVTRFPGAQYKSFPTRAAAEQYLADNPPLEVPPLESSRLDQITGEQRSVLDFMLRGDNVFLTGGGGVGKSYLLSVIYTEYPGMRRRRDGARLPRIQMCALTGCAALLLGHKAKTIHSWAGIGLGKGTVAELHMKIKKNRKAMQKWLLTDLLIIDEISMMTAELLDKLNELGKKLRGNKRPFGGIQLLLVGDFYQLPPVNRSDEPTRFAFESEAWKEGIQTIVELTQIQRQKDEVFQKILTEARRGALTSESCATLRSREGLDWKANKIKPTLLFPRRAEVELINETNIKALKGARHTYKARLVYDGKMPAGFLETDEGFQQALQKFDADAAYSTNLELVQDAQVMLIANVDPDAGLVNGSRGYIVGFCGASDLPMVEFVNGVRRPIGTHGWPIEEYEFCARTQIPLRLAWAITTHKCISGHTLLSLPNYGLIPIKNLELENQPEGSIHYPTQLTISGAHETKHILEIYKGHIEDGITLETSFGYEITGSYRHPLLVYNHIEQTFEWKTIPEIDIDDYIIIKRGAKVEGSYYTLNLLHFENTQYKKYISVPNYINEDFGYLLGVYLGDGSINKRTYRFDLVSMDLDIINKCVNILQTLFGIHLELHEYPNRKTKTWRIFFHSRQLVELFDHIGYKFEKATKKEIPFAIMRSPLSVQKSLIKGLYDTDGGVSRTCLNFTSTSPIMVKQLQEILLNIGVLSSKNVLHDADVDKHWSKAYRLTISGKSAVEFNKQIGFMCQRKKIISEERFKLTNNLRKDNNSQAFGIPNGDLLINKLRNEMYNGLKRLKSTQITLTGRKILSDIINKRQILRCDSINVIMESITNIEQYPTGKLLAFIYTNGIMIDTIRKKEIVQNIQMYDIAVSPLNTSGYLPDGHDFIAGGFINHNCQGSTLDSALVDIGSGNFEFGQAYVALSRARSLEALYVHDFDPIAFKAHPKVKAFYHSMVRAEMEPGEQAEIRESVVPDAKAVIAEPSRAIQGICVTKLDESDSKESLEPAEAASALDPGTVVTTPVINWLYDTVPSSWKACVSAEALAPLSALLNTKTFLPPREQIWTALTLTALQDIKVVILGQDPYPTPGNAHGLAFSVLPDVRPIPASLRNIYKELASDIGCNAPAHGNLTKWAERGVLLLNTVLTVEAGAPQSHTKIGWEEVTDQLIRCIAAQTKGVVFVLWGKSAQVKKKLLAMYMQSHRVIETAHPSPLSASKGFLGSKVFSQVNQLRTEMGKEAINWSL